MDWLIPLNMIIPVVFVIIILIAIMWILYLKNKEMHGKLSSEKQKFSMYLKEIENLRLSSKNPERDFEKLNQIVRNFFKEYFNLDYSLTYLELEKEFKKQNKTEYADFCKSMSDVNYSSQKTKPEEIKHLIDFFFKILKNY